jgi:hypothetical protein
MQLIIVRMVKLLFMTQTVFWKIMHCWSNSNGFYFKN